MMQRDASASRASWSHSAVLAEARQADDIAGLLQCGARLRACAPISTPRFPVTDLPTAVDRVDSHRLRLTFDAIDSTAVGAA
jgi:hypothetical protein